MSVGYCQCGCGIITPVAIRNRFDIGHIKGEHVPYFHGHNSKKSEQDFWDLIKFWPSDIMRSFCWLWQGGVNKTTGYGKGFRLANEELAHRVAYALVKGYIPDGLELDHLCRNRRCVNPDHLEAVTHTVNVRRGAQTKLSYSDVSEIRSMNASGRKMAKMYGVSHSTVDAILNGKSWIN